MRIPYISKAISIGYDFAKSIVSNPNETSRQEGTSAPSIDEKVEKLFMHDSTEGLTMADLNNSGSEDIIAAIYKNGLAYFHVGKTVNDEIEMSDEPIGYAPADYGEVAIGTGDMSGNGKLDVIVASRKKHPNERDYNLVDMYIFDSQEDGSFLRNYVGEFTTKYPTIAVATAYIDDDDKLDVYLVSLDGKGNQEITTLINQGLWVKL